MSRTQKLRYDFPRQLCLEVSYNNTDWFRVTCETFRAFRGPRRVQGNDYTGPVYYKGTNYKHVGKTKQPRVIEITELNEKVKKRHKQEARMAKIKPNTKFLD